MVGVDANIEVDLSPSVSLCDNCASGVNDVGDGEDSPKDFPCLSEGLKNCAVRRQLAG
jgi:hypothetical protein